MILADKIIELRKKAGWSQEELAAQLNVSRQSVSKWEGAQSTPDMNKILQMSELFGVTTDYLLKDELGEPEYTGIDEHRSVDNEPVRKVSMEEANRYLDTVRAHCHRIALGVAMCIVSCTPLIVIACREEAIGRFDSPIVYLGVAILLAIVAAAVGIFISSGMKLNKFEYLEKENIETEYGVSGMVKERRDEYEGTHTRWMVIGICSCILAVVPLMAVLFMAGDHNDLFAAYGVCILLWLVACGVYMIVKTSMIWDSYRKLLEEGDYTRSNKSVSAPMGIYWTVVTALYLLVSFVTMRWDRTWLIWPVAGVLSAAIKEFLKGRNKRA